MRYNPDTRPILDDRLDNGSDVRALKAQTKALIQHLEAGVEARERVIAITRAGKRELGDAVKERDGVIKALEAEIRQLKESASTWSKPSDAEDRRSAEKHYRIMKDLQELWTMADEANEILALEPVVMMLKGVFGPEIVCLCGSTRFMEAFFEEGGRLTLEGKIVLSVGVCKHAEHHGAEALGQDVVEALDELHKRKIDLCNSVFVLNVGGYIGDSTRSEIEYAEKIGRPVEYLEALEEKS